MRHELAEPNHAACYYAANPFEGLVFFFTALTVGTFILFLTMFPQFHGVQQTVVIYTLGMGYALLGEYYKFYETTGMFGRSYCMWMNIDPHLLLFSMLPALITGDAMSIDTAVARRVYRQCIHLAGPGVLFSSFATALFLWWYLPYGWSFLLCLTVGSILAATDPVAVVNLLKELGASPTLTVQIQGESLLNDGTAMVLYSVTSKMLEGEKFDTNKIIIFLLQVVLAACAVGAVLGWCCTVWIRLSCRRLDDHSSFVQISITLLCAYWSYILADGLFGMSGVLTTVSSALVLADRMWPTIVSKESMDNAWHMFEFMGNTAIFFLAGSWTGSIMYQIDANDYLHLIVIYIVSFVVRGVMLVLSMPIMQLLGEDIKPVSLADCAVMCWGGLRGAVGLSLAIHLSIDRAGGSLDKADGTRVLFFTSGIAALTLLVNATTCPLLVKHLGIARTSKTRILVMNRVHQQLMRKSNERTRNKEVNDQASEKVAKLNDTTAQIMDGMLLDVKHVIAGDKKHKNGCLKAIMGHQSEGEGSEEPPVSESSSQALADKHKHELGSERPDGGEVHHRTSRSSRFGRKDSQSSVISFDDGPTLLMHHDSARRAHVRVDLEMMELLRFPVFHEIHDDERERLFALVSSAKPHRSMHILVREAFTNLLRAHYWEMNQKGEFLDDQEVRSTLMQSLSSSGDDEGRAQLSDLRYIINRIMNDGELHLDDVGYHFDEDILNLEKAEQSHSDDGAMGCCAQIESSQIFSTVMVLIILANTVTIAIELGDAEGGGGSWMPLVNLGFGLAYLVEFAVRFGALHFAYFFDAWNIFDFTLLIIGLAGIVLEFFMMTGNMNQSQSARIARVVKIFRVLRNVRIGFRVVFAAQQHGLSRKVDLSKGVSGIMAALYNLKNSDQTAARVRLVHMLSAFVKAHIHSQDQFVMYFGQNGRLQSTEAARCILDSQTQVLAATVMACNVARLVDWAALEALYVLSDSTRVAEELLHFVEGAHTSGILGAREAETLQHPLKARMSELSSLLHRATRGEIGAFKDTMSSMVWFQRVLSIKPDVPAKGSKSKESLGTSGTLPNLDTLKGPGQQEDWEKSRNGLDSMQSLHTDNEDFRQPSWKVAHQSLDNRTNIHEHGLSWSQDERQEEVERAERAERSFLEAMEPRHYPAGPKAPSPPASIPASMPQSPQCSPLASPRCPTPPDQELDTTMRSIAHLLAAAQKMA